MRKLIFVLSAVFFSNAYAQVQTVGSAARDCNQQSPRLLMNSSHFRLGGTARVTVQAPHPGAQVVYLLATTVPEKTIPQGYPLGLGSLVSYIDLQDAVIFSVVTNEAGTGELTFPVGTNPSLVGVNVYFQAFSLETPKCSGLSAYSNSPLRSVMVRSNSALAAPAPMVNSVTSGSITWTFDRSVESGTFYNGHRWVKGPVRVTSISPAPANGRNGSMVDPNALGLQAYDSRRNYDASLAANPTTLDFTSSTTIRSLVSTVSTPSSEQNRFLQEVQVLTIIPANQPNPSPLALRPSYHQGQKIFVSVEDLVEEPDTLFSFLPGNAQYGVSMPTLSELDALVSGATFPVARGDWGTNAFNGAYPGYGRELAALISNGMLYALHQGVPRRKEIIASILQLGIDIAGVTANGGAQSAFRGDGGQMNGRKFPLVALAKALIPGSKKTSLYANIAASRFSEDDQIRTGNPWFNPNTGTAFHFSFDREVDLTHPSTWAQGEFHKANYKFCCTYNVAGGTSIATSLIQGWDAWQNDRFKIGVDGYYRVENLLDQYNVINSYTVEAGNQPLGPASWFIDSQGHGLHWSTFVREVWEVYAPIYAPE